MSTTQDVLPSSSLSSFSQTNVAGQPPSPTTLALASLNMTRDDLARHTVQMRSFLSTDPLAANNPYDHDHDDDDPEHDQLVDEDHGNLASPSQQAAPTSVTSETLRRSASATRINMDAVIDAQTRQKSVTARGSRKGAVGGSVPLVVVPGAPPASSNASSSAVYSLQPPPPPSASSRAPDASQPRNASRSSSVCSSLAYQQDVFYSRPTSVAPSSALSHPSLRRSSSSSSQLSTAAHAALADEVEEEAKEENDALVDALLGLDQPQGIKNNSSSRASSTFSMQSSAAATGGVTTTAPMITPAKRGQPSTTTPAVHHHGLALPPSSSTIHANIPSSSPVYQYNQSSPNDPRTPYRAPHHLRTTIIGGASRRPPHAAIPSSSPMPPVPVTSSPAGVDGSPSSAVPYNLPSGPRLTSKPHYSYAALIGQALASAQGGRLSLNQIYTWISLAYPYFKRGESGWQNSIRHNLSLNGCFVKIKRDDGEKGKGSWWAIREGDEPCFAGGGFQRQGRANGRKRKGKAEREAEANREEADEAEDAEAGASPKKKKKTVTGGPAARTAQPSSGLPRPYARSVSTSTATSVHTMASTASYESTTSSYNGPAGGYGGTVMYYPPAAYAAAAASAYGRSLPPYAQPASERSTAVEDLPQHPQETPKSSRTSHVRTPASQGYLLRPASAAPSLSPLATRGGPARSMTGDDDDDDLESEDDLEEAARRQSMLLPAPPALNPTPHRYEETSHERHTDSAAMDDSEDGDELEEPPEVPEDPVDEEMSSTPPPPPQLGQPFTMQAEPSSERKGGSVLQSGFTFIPPASKNTGGDMAMVGVVKQEPIDDVADVAQLGMKASEDDQFSKFFASSPVPPTTQRVRPTPTKPPSSRSSMGGTDLLSRVLESKSLKRGSGHGHQSSTSSSAAKFLFPVPSTAGRKDARPSTPPPRTRTLSFRDETDKLLKDLDPTTAAAVTALASLSPMRTPVSHAAFHMSPAPPPSSDLTHYKHSLGPPVSPFRTPGRTASSGSGAGRPFDYYDFLGDASAGLADDLDKAFGVASTGTGRSSASGLLGSNGVPRTPATPNTGGLFGSSSLYQSPSLPSPGWRRY